MGYSESSSANIVENYPIGEDSTVKEYDEISVQAVDMLDAKATITTKAAAAPAVPKPTYSEVYVQAGELIVQTDNKGINESQLPPQTFDNDTDFTTYFHKVDQSVQGRPDFGHSVAMQYEANNVDISVQGEDDRVDFSVQKNTPVEMVDCSIQKYEVGREDISVQHYWERDGVDASVQEFPPGRDISIQQDPSKRDYSIQREPIGQEDSL